MHARETGGRSLRFGHRGWLWNNSYLLYDRETDSIWHHQTGRALSGPLRGAALARWPTVLVTWEAWRAEHPDTLVLPKPATHANRIDVDVYSARNAGLRFGIGVEIGSERCLYPLRDLEAGPIADTVAGVPIVVALDRDGRTAFAYDRRLGETLLTFEAGEDSDGVPLLRSVPEGREFRLRSGRPVGGDAALLPVFWNQWEVGAWRAQHPTGRLFKPR